MGRPRISEVRHRFRIVLDLSFDLTLLFTLESPDKVSQVEQVGKCSTKTFESILVRLNCKLSKRVLHDYNQLAYRAAHKFSYRITPFHLTQFFPASKYVFIAFSLQCIEWCCGKATLLCKGNVCASALREGEIRFSSCCAIVLLFIIRTNNNNIFYIGTSPIILT